MKHCTATPGLVSPGIHMCTYEDQTTRGANMEKMYRIMRARFLCSAGLVCTLHLTWKACS